MSPFAGGHDGRDGVMVMRRRGGATPHPATEPSAASSRFYAAGIAETVHLDTGDVRIFARRASHATMARRARSPHRKLCIDIQLWLKNADWPRAPPGARWY